LVHAVSKLFSCSVYQVLNALEKEATSDEWGATSLSPAWKRGRAQGTTRLSPARRRGRVAGIVESTVFSDVDSTKHGADASHRGLMGRSDTDVAMAVATRAIGAGARPKNVDVGEREQCSSGREQDDTPSSASSISSSSISDQDDPSEDSSDKVVYDHAAQDIHVNIVPRQFKLELL
jgi:hypothetical protein